MDERTLVTVDADGELGIDTEPVPTPGEGELLVEVHASMLSPGTEGSIIRNRREGDSSGGAVPLGYQNAGRVAETGPGVDRFAEGDRVACMGSRYAVHADYAAVPVNLAVALPDGVSFAEGAGANLYGTAMNAVRRADLRLGERVAVFGLGMVGQLVTQLADASGCHALGVDLFENRRRIAAGAGAERVVSPEDDPVAAAEAISSGYGVDAGFVCFGGDASGVVDTIAEMAKRRPDGHQMGRIVVVGGAEITQRFPVPLGNMDVRAASRTGPGYHDDAYERGASYPDALVDWDTNRNLREFVSLVDRDRVDVASLQTHRFPLTEAADAYDLALSTPEESLGVVLEP